MLQEIISQMYVDPELLEQLSDELKEVLFRKMREEQVRRWNEKEQELEERPAKKTARKINFTMGVDGSPWVWVMGEHKDDLPYNQLMRRREQEEVDKERQREVQDRKEAASLAKHERMGIQSLATVFGATGKFRKPLRKSSGVDTTDSPSAQQLLSPNRHLSVVRTESQMGSCGSPMPNRRGGSQEEDEEERELTMSRKATIIGLTDEAQSKFEIERTEEVFMSLQRARSISKKRAASVAQNVEKMWQESQKKAKEFDRVRRTSFKKAQELTAKSPDIPDKILESIPVDKQKEIIRRMTLERKPRRQAPGAPRGRSDHRGQFKKQSSFVRPGTVPKSTSHVISWFNKSEAPKGIGRERDGSFSIWFHGKLSREGAAKVLEWKPVGSFVVRLSSKIWGYVVSVKTYTVCKHFLVDASSGQYCFVGPKQQRFPTLVTLIKFYKENPITWSGQEVLLIPVGQEEETMELYRGLYDDEGLSEEILADLTAGVEYQGSTL